MQTTFTSVRRLIKHMASGRLVLQAFQLTNSQIEPEASEPKKFLVDVVAVPEDLAGPSI